MAEDGAVATGKAEVGGIIRYNNKGNNTKERGRKRRDEGYMRGWKGGKKGGRRVCVYVCVMDRMRNLLDKHKITMRTLK